MKHAVLRGTVLYLFAAIVAMVAIVAAPCIAADDHFNIVWFEVEGNTLLSEAEVQAAVSPLSGANRVYGDIQKALEALEHAYRAAGYGTVQVYVPEQELAGGVVRLKVTESAIGKILVSGNQRFDEANIRASLPALKEGGVPNLRRMSENIQLSNESPAKQIEVSLAVGKDEGKVDARVLVAEDNPQRAYMTADSSGTKATGVSRVGLAYQHANLFNRDHNLTLAYTGSADAPTGVKVDIFSLGYRIPFYALGDSLDLIYGKSSVNTPSSSPSLGGSQLGIVGKGDVAGVRWNHHFARRGEYSSKLVAGLDYKYIDARCNTAGAPMDINPPTPTTGACVPYTTRPVSLAYAAQRQSPGQAFDYNVGIAYNLALGTRYTNVDGAIDRYSYLTSGNRTTRDDFSIIRSGGSYLKAFQSDWQLRIAASGQYAGNPLVAAEQFGLAGANAVRGFNERAVTADSGYLANVEFYTPELSKLTGGRGSLRGLAFYDFARGINHNVPSGSLTPARLGIASAGVGARYALRKDFSLRFDVAQVLDAGPPNTKERGEWRGHLSLMLAY